MIEGSLIGSVKGTLSTPEEMGISFKSLLSGYSSLLCARRADKYIRENTEFKSFCGCCELVEFSAYLLRVIKVMLIFDESNLNFGGKYLNNRSHIRSLSGDRLQVL